MNEAKIVVHDGDNFDKIVDTALNVVKINSISFVAFDFNGIRVYVKKDSTAENISDEYLKRLRSA